MRDTSGLRGAFTSAFRPWASRVRLRLMIRSALTGAAIGAAGSALLALAFWGLGRPALHPALLFPVFSGLLAALFYSYRRRWSDSDVALYLDARLGQHELINTALLTDDHGPHGPAASILWQRARSALVEASPRAARPPVLRRLQGLLLVSAGVVAVLAAFPLPARGGKSAAPGSALVKQTDVPGLDRIVELENVAGRSPEQTRRLRELAERARRLRAELAQGVEQRAALAELAKLKDDIAAERLKLADADNRAGLEAAIQQLQKQAELSAAAKALGDGDLVEFDQQMQQLANRLEQAHREAAREALEQAAKAARERGARSAAEALAEQQRLLSERGASADALRELAEALSDQLTPEEREALSDFAESGSPEARRKVARALERALGQLSDEQRRALAERLKQRIAKNGAEATPLTDEQLEELARRLSTKQGQKELAEQLKKLGEPGKSGEAERDRSLDDAERGGAEAQRSLGGILPMPMPGPGSAGPQPGGQQTPGNAQNQAPGGGPSRGPGSGSHEGRTAELPNAKPLPARAHATLNPGAPMAAASPGRGAARPGETANQVGTGALPSVSRSEVGAVERSDVPEEYREQVGRYFEP